MNEDNIKVSILIPVYNNQAYLAECLESVLAQTEREIEIICINDGSSDQTPQILAQYAAKDQRIQVIDKPNTGYGASMNRGLTVARGEYIGIVESDDVVKPEMFEKLYHAAVENQAEIAVCDFCRFWGSGEKRSFQYVNACEDSACYAQVCNAADKTALLWGTNIWNAIYRRKFLEENNIWFNETPGASYQDNGFFMQTFCQAERVILLKEALYLCRRDNPGSSIFNKEKVYCMTEEYQFIRHFLESKPALKEKFIKPFQTRRFTSFYFTYVRIDERLRREYLHHLQQEFLPAQTAGELDESLFQPRKWADLQLILRDPEEFYWRGRLGDDALKKQIQQLRQDIEGIEQSPSYKIGRVLTWIPRKFRALLGSTLRR